MSVYLIEFVSAVVRLYVRITFLSRNLVIFPRTKRMKRLMGTALRLMFACVEIELGLSLPPPSSSSDRPITFRILLRFRPLLLFEILSFFLSLSLFSFDSH